MDDRDTTARVLHALDGIIDFVEEPMPVHDSTGRKHLSQRSAVPSLGDDSVFTYHDVARQISFGVVSRMSIKLPRSGYLNARCIVSLCKAADMPIQINIQGETTLGTAAYLKLAAAVPQISKPLELTYCLEVTPIMIRTQLKIKNGKMLADDRIESGVDVDWELLNQYRNRL